MVTPVVEVIAIVALVISVLLLIFVVHCMRSHGSARNNRRSILSRLASPFGLHRTSSSLSVSPLTLTAPPPPFLPQPLRLPPYASPSLRAAAAAAVANARSHNPTLPSSVTVHRTLPPHYVASGDEACPICLDPLAGEPVATGRCDHPIHADCLVAWMGKDPRLTCPICRQPMVDWPPAETLDDLLVPDHQHHHHHLHLQPAFTPFDPDYQLFNHDHRNMRAPAPQQHHHQHPPPPPPPQPLSDQMHHHHHAQTHATAPQHSPHSLGRSARHPQSRSRTPSFANNTPPLTPGQQALATEHAWPEQPFRLGHGARSPRADGGALPRATASATALQLPPPPLPPSPLGDAPPPIPPSSQEQAESPGAPPATTVPDTVAVDGVDEIQARRPPGSPGMDSATITPRSAPTSASAPRIDSQEQRESLEKAAQNV